MFVEQYSHENEFRDATKTHVRQQKHNLRIPEEIRLFRTLPTTAKPEDFEGHSPSYFLTREQEKALLKQTLRACKCLKSADSD
eukprot:2802019-Amphidinium_carterae.1